MNTAPASGGPVSPRAPRAIASVPARAARWARALRLAGAVLGEGSQFAPLGENRELIARLVARVRAARDCGA
jgi:hypothetical protein